MTNFVKKARRCGIFDHFEVRLSDPVRSSGLIGLAALLVLQGCAATRWETVDVPTREPEESAQAERASRPPTRPESAGSTSALTRLQTFYAEWRGTPYRFGGTGRDGVDCSALTQRAMSEVYGTRLPRTTRLQLTAGRSISASEVRPGDLVFFKTGDTLNHVGIITGPGRFMHASTKQGVTISALSERYWAQRVIGFRRVAGQ